LSKLHSIYQNVEVPNPNALMGGSINPEYFKSLGPVRIEGKELHPVY